MLTINTSTCSYAKSISHNLGSHTGAGTQHKQVQWEFKPSSRIATQDMRDCTLCLRNQEKQSPEKRATKSTPTNLSPHSQWEQTPKYSKRLSSLGNLCILGHGIERIPGAKLLWNPRITFWSLELRHPETNCPSTPTALYDNPNQDFPFDLTPTVSYD